MATREADDLRLAEAQVIATLRRRFPDFDDAELEDCWQQAFAELWRGERPPTALLTVAAVRRATDRWRRRRRAAQLVDEPVDADLDPAAIVQRRVDVQRGAELLTMLPEHHQRIWRAYCDTGARHNPRAIAAIAEAEELAPRQVTKVIEKVQEKARRIAAEGLSADGDAGPAFCRRLSKRIAAHLDGTPDLVAERHLATCARCRETYGRARRIDRAFVLAPIIWLKEHLAVAAVIGASAAAGGVVVTASVVTERPLDPPPRVVREIPKAPARPEAAKGVAAPRPARPEPRHPPRRTKRRATTNPAKTPAPRRTTTPLVPQATTPPAAPPRAPRTAPARPKPRAGPGDEFGFER